MKNMLLQPVKGQAKGFPAHAEEMRSHRAETASHGRHSRLPPSFCLRERVVLCCVSFVAVIIHNTRCLRPAFAYVRRQHKITRKHRRLSTSIHLYIQHSLKQSQDTKLSQRVVGVHSVIHFTADSTNRCLQATLQRQAPRIEKQAHKSPSLRRACMDKLKTKGGRGRGCPRGQGPGVSLCVCGGRGRHLPVPTPPPWKSDKTKLCSSTKLATGTQFS